MTEVVMVEKKDRLKPSEFYSEYVDRSAPVVITNSVGDWPAIQKWDLDYFRSISADIQVPLKRGNVSKGDRVMVKLGRYLDLIDEYESFRNAKMERPPYLHDVPIFNLIPSLKNDIVPFPIELFPQWYHSDWQNYIQFFMSCTGHVTPLHFDTLWTHNLFFQVRGYKKFVVISRKYAKYCYLEKWRWTPVNPVAPDFEKYPLFKKVDVQEVIIGPGDIIYLPPGTLHYVESCTQSISFNIDWHTPKSVGYGMTTVLSGAPLKNFYFNTLIALGIYLRFPPKVVFPFYKSYLNYVS
jgi:hypothetical protein